MIVGTPMLLSLALAAGLLLVLVGVSGAMPWVPVWTFIKARTRRLPLRSLVLALLAGLSVGWATGWPVAAVAVGIGALTIPRMIRQPGVSQMIATRDALAEWAQRLANILAAGTGGIEEAIIRSARTTPAALTAPVTDLASRIRHRGLVPALRAFADDINDVTGDALAASLILRATDGGRGLLAVLDGLSSALRKDADARRAIEADRAKPRTQMKIIMAIVVGITAVLLLTSGLFAPYDLPGGQLWLAVVAVIWGIAFWLADRLTRPERPMRFLVGGKPT